MKFDINELVKRSLLDYVGLPFPNFAYDVSVKNGKLKVSKKGKEMDLLSINRDQLLGGKFFMKIKLAYCPPNGDYYVDRTVFELPNEPIISIGLSKKIIETATVGKQRKGTVKEYICTEDYQISIKGVCVDLENPEAYPSEQVGVLNDMFEINDALDVDSNPFFELFGIRKIVLKDIQFDEMIGEAGLQRYTITAVSDEDFYAELSEIDN